MATSVDEIKISIDENCPRIPYQHIEEVVELSDFPPTYFDVKWTLKEYEEELAKPIE